MNKKEKSFKIVLGIAAFLIPIAVMIGVLIIQKATPFGSASFLYADAYDQYYSMFHEMLDWIKSPDHSMFLWSRGMGVDIYTNFLYYNISIFNIIPLIMGEAELEVSMTFVIIAKMAFMSLFTYIFFMKTRRFHSEKPGFVFRGFLSLAAALAFSLCNFVLAYNNNLMWLDALIMLPLLALAIERLADKGKWGMFMVCLSLTMLCNFYFSIYICLFCFLYFIMLDYGKTKGFIQSFIVFARTAVISACLMGVVLVPAFMAIMNRGNYDYSVSIEAIPKFGNLISFINSFFPMTPVDGLGGSMYTYNYYCGGVAVLLLCFFFADQRLGKWYRVKYALVCLVLAVATNVKPLSYILHGFSYPHGMGNRFAFILVFFLITASFEFLSCDTNPQLLRTVVSGGLYLAVLVVCMLLSPEKRSAVMLVIVAFFLFLAVCYARKSIKPTTFRIWTVSFWALEIIANALIVAPEKVNSEQFTKVINYDFYKDFYESLQLNPGERKTSLNSRNYVCASDTNWYSSLLNGNMVDSFQSLGLSNYEVAEVTYRGTTPFTALLYNVRYVLSNETGMNGGYHKVYETDGTDLMLYEADNNAGMGFMVSDKVLEWKGNKSVDKNQNELWHLMLDTDEDIFVDPPATLLSRVPFLMDVVSNTKNTVNYICPTLMNGNLTLSYKINRDFDMYFWSEDGSCHVVTVYEGSTPIAASIYTDTANIVSVGDVYKGETINVTMESGAANGKKGIIKYKLMAFDNEVFSEGLSKLLDEKYEVSEIKGNTMKGSVNALADGVLYLSVPYSDGYSVFVDGRKDSLHKIGTGLSGVKLSAGQHEVVLSYRTPGLFAGLMLSLAGVLALVVTLILNRFLNVSGAKRMMK